MLFGDKDEIQSNVAHNGSIIELRKSGPSIQNDLDTILQQTALRGQRGVQVVKQPHSTSQAGREDLY